MDLIKKLTGKNPSEYEPIAKSLVDNSDTELFKKLVQQDDFLFDFIKNNVAQRIQNACTKENYKNLLNFLDYYSPSYDTMIASVLNIFGAEDVFSEMKELFLNGNNSQKAYAARYLLLHGGFESLIDKIREYSHSEYEPLAVNCIELLSAVNDSVSKTEAVENLSSTDEFEQFEAVKYLVNFGAKDVLDKIVEVMKTSSLSENIASEIPYLADIEEFAESNYENAMLVLCNIINALPDIIPLSSIRDYNLADVFQKLISKPLDSISAVVLMLAKDKFKELASNDEYLFDLDKNTKDEVNKINDMLNKLNISKLKSLLYDELYEESNFIFFAVDYADDIEELETLIESDNQTLILKVLTILKEKNALKDEHKQAALNRVTNQDIKNIINAL